LRPITAIVLAGVLNTLGATQIGGVAKTITSGLVIPDATNSLMILAAVFGAIIWNLTTWYFGIPSSSSYALVGGLVGAALVHAGPAIVLWKGVIYLVIIPMILSPLIGFILAFSLMKGLTAFGSKRKGTKLFQRLQIISAGCVSLAHGLNDAQKSMGLITLGLFAGGVILSDQIPLWVILSCALVMGIGTATGGVRIIRTVGFEITKIEPIQGFAAESSASIVILAASALGMPISSAHMIVGSVTGVGASRGMSAVRWKVARKVIIAWCLTLPGAALVSAGAYFMFSAFS
jgi:PiT family inorganic phosphate transporter